MAEAGQVQTPALQALLRDGKLAGSWTLDPARTEIRLTSRHMWGLGPVKGVFRQVEGVGTVSAAGDVTGALAVAAGSIDTKNPKRDEHLRTADFLDVAAYPDITFALEGASAADDGSARITGSLTAHGSTRPLSFDVKADMVDGEVWLDGEVPVNRADFGVTKTMMGMLSLKNTMAVHAVFTRQ
jgi:polyisoprenoid-binding protein YceI